MRPYYEQDGITIYHGDCLEVEAWRGVDVVVTDPPYGIGWTRNAGVWRSRKSKAHDGITNDHDTSARDEALALVAGKPCVVFGSFYAPYPANVRQVLVWHKPADAGVVGATTGYRRDVEPVFLVGDWPVRPVRWAGVLRSSAGGISAVVTATGHPHTKPVDLMVRLIDACPDGVVADPFMGSGTTLVAAKRLGRKAIGIEIEERYCEIAAERLCQRALPLTAAVEVEIA
jgi:DNA modification methylase